MVKYFFAGMFLFNGVPHLVKGITGEKHMTPFKRVSSAHLNVVWAFANFVLGLVIMGFDPVTGRLAFPRGVQVWAFLAGGFALALVAAQLWSNPKARLPWHKD